MVIAGGGGSRRLGGGDGERYDGGRDGLGTWGIEGGVARAGGVTGREGRGTGGVVWLLGFLLVAR